MSAYEAIVWATILVLGTWCIADAIITTTRRRRPVYGPLAKFGPKNNDDYWRDWMGGDDAA